MGGLSLNVMKSGTIQFWMLTLLCGPFWVSAQGTFLEKHLYSEWVSGEEELNFLRASADNNIYGGAEHPTDFQFQGITYTPPVDGAQWAAMRQLECCMCSYTALVQNTPDTLRLERGGRGDFGPISVTTHTFFVEGGDLVQVPSKYVEDEGTTETRRLWQPSPSRASVVQPVPEGQWHSNCWVPLNVRAAPRMDSEVVGQLEWGDAVTVLDQGSEALEVDLDFASGFGAKSPQFDMRSYALRRPFMKVAFEGGEGHVFAGLLSERAPFDFASYYVAPAAPTEPQPEGRFERSDVALLWEEVIELEEREEGMATKTFRGYADGVVVKHWYDGKYQFGVTVEIPLGRPDEFYVVSNNLLRFLSPLGFDSLAIFPDRFYADFSPMSESFITELSPDGTKMYIHYGGGGC